MRSPLRIPTSRSSRRVAQLANDEVRRVTRTNHVLLGISRRRHLRAHQPLAADGRAGRDDGAFPGAPKNRMGYLDDYMPASQRKVVTPNNDTIYGAGFADLADDSVVIQTPTDVPEATTGRSRSSTSSPPSPTSSARPPARREASCCWSGRTGPARNPQASSTYSARRPTSPAFSAAASPHIRARRRRGRARCSIRSAWCR